jgi:hypothetical protein
MKRFFKSLSRATKARRAWRIHHPHRRHTQQGWWGSE